MAIQTQATSKSKATKKPLASAEEIEAANAGTVEDLGVLGQIDESAFAEAETVHGIEDLPKLMPGKPGFEPGQVVGGTFLGMRRQPTKKNGRGAKVDKVTGQKYYDIATLENNGVRFIVFCSASLTQKLSTVNVGDAVMMKLLEEKIDTPNGPAWDFIVRVKRKQVVATTTSLS